MPLTIVPVRPVPVPSVPTPKHQTPKPPPPPTAAPPSAPPTPQPVPPPTKPTKAPPKPQPTPPTPPPTPPTPPPTPPTPKPKPPPTPKPKPTPPTPKPTPPTPKPKPTPPTPKPTPPTPKPTPPTPKPTPPTPKPTPQPPPAPPGPPGNLKDFVMCTVGAHFNEPDKYINIPCDYIIHDNMVGTSKGIFPTQDFTAWENFLELVAKKPTPVLGISFMGRFYEDTAYGWNTATAKKDMTRLADMGITAYGISGIPLPSATAEVDTFVAQVAHFFSGLASANSTLVQKGQQFTTFCSVKINARSAPNLEDFMKKFTGDLVVVVTHNALLPVAPSNVSHCSLTPASSWNQGGNELAVAESALSGMTPQICVGVSFTMAVLLHAYNTTIPANAPPATCTYKSMVRYGDWCPYRSGEAYDNTKLTTTNIIGQTVATYSTTKSMEDSIKKLTNTVKYPFGVMLHDIQFDMLETDDCKPEESLGRVKHVAGIIHGQPHG
ncbi:mucin-6-like [Ornithodoros turicata]|uniref:mucin-6-like n=1 Tax=Ornithodoros turicata TaxID=34597 RepID=UPI00313A0C7F